MAKAAGIKGKEQKRKKIMEAALKIFSKKGYSPAAIDEVAREAGIAKGTLYLYFQDKEDLFCSTILHVIDNLALLLQKNINEQMNPLEILKSLAFYQLKFFSQNRDFFGIFQTIINENLLSSHKKLFNLLLIRKQDLINYEINVIDRGKREGLIRSDIESEEIVNSFDGMVTNSIKQMGYCNNNVNTGIDVEKKVKSIMQILLDGVSERK